MSQPNIVLFMADQLRCDVLGCYGNQICKMPNLDRLAKESLGVAPERCVGIEDAAVHIEAIQAAGMFAVGVGNPETVKKADLILKDMTEYPEILKRLESGTGGLQP